MCLAAVYEVGIDDNRELVLDKVQHIDVDGDTITVSNLFGTVQELKGTIRTIDFSDSVVIVDSGQPTR